MNHRADEDSAQRVDLSDEAFCWTLSRLVFLGARAMLALQRRDGPAVDEEEWRTIVLREAPELAEERPVRQSPQLPLFDDGLLRRGVRGRSSAHHGHLLTWLWDALSRRSLLPLVANSERPTSVAVLPAGSVFRFELGRSIPEDIRAVIDGPLLMRAGKRGRLECEPVATRVVVGDEPAIEVGSLNEGYTALSQRREPHRHSHTGNVYGKAFWVADATAPAGITTREADGERLIRLGQIRAAVTRGVWPCPSTARSSSSLPDPIEQSSL